jgi:hypothetical protein
MTNLPEKLWLLPLWGTEYPQDCRVSEEKEDDDSQEYIRKDIYDAPNSNIKALCDQLAKVSMERTKAHERVKELEEALESISCMGFDMPATLELTDEAWSRRRAGLMPLIAREALMDTNK